MNGFNNRSSRFSAVQPVELVVAGLAHDVRGALGAIRLHAADAVAKLDDTDTVGVQRSLTRIESSVGWVSELCDDLLECSRRRATSDGPEPIHFDLSGCVLSCMATQFAAADRANCVLELAVQPNLRVVSHPLSVQRILVNLVRNALRHGAGGSIRILVSGDGNHVSISVRDSGCGMAPDVVSRLLAPFQQGDGGDVSFRSFGLGLWIVSSLVASLGGTLNVESEAGVGTAVCCRLPQELDTQLETSLARASS